MNGRFERVRKLVIAGLLVFAGAASGAYVFAEDHRVIKDKEFSFDPTQKGSLSTDQADFLSSADAYQWFEVGDHAAELEGAWHVSNQQTPSLAALNIMQAIKHQLQKEGRSFEEVMVIAIKLKHSSSP